MDQKPTSRLTPVSQPMAQSRSTAVPETVTLGKADIQDNDIDLLQMLGVLWRGKWTMLLCAFLAVVLGGIYAFQVAKPKYSATATLVLQARNQQVVDLESVISGVSTEEAAINTELRVILSRNLIEQLITDLKLHEDPGFNSDLTEPSVFSPDNVIRFVAGIFGMPMVVDPPLTEEEILYKIVRSVRKTIVVSSQRDTYLFDIKVTTGNPDKSALIANQLAEIYLNDQVRIKFAATEYAVDWLSGRVIELELELDEKENTIKELRAETDLVSLDALEALNIRAKDIRERLTDARLAAMNAQSKLTELSEITASQDIDAIAAFLDDPTLFQYAQQARAGHPNAVQQFFSRVKEHEVQEQAQLERMILQRDALEASLEQFEVQVNEQNLDLVELNKLAREADAIRVLYGTFLARLKETSVQIGLQQPDTRILSKASLGEKVRPRKAMILALSLLLGAMFGAGFVLLRQSMHRGFRTATELEQMTGLAVLGQIPRMSFRRRKKLMEYLRSKSTSAASEAIRNLRTSILLSDVDNPPKIIMSTSSIPGEGKTTQAISLAHNLAGLDKKVLLIEGDIRRRTFSQYMENSSTGGLVSVVSGELSIEDAVVCDTGLGVDVLMGDKSSINAADLFSSTKFRNFLTAAREAYDFVIIDTPPVLVVPDARVIGHLVDSIIYTVNWDKTTKAQVLDGLRQFSSVGLRVSGLVLAQIDARGMKRYGYGDGYGAYAAYGKGYYDI